MSTVQPFDSRSPFDAIRRTRPDGSEFWSARDLMPLMGYGADWRNFQTAIERARAAATNSGHDVETLFGDVTEKTQGRPREDFHLARMAAYLVSLNGDPRKPETAAAQAYFVIRTREAETTPAVRPEQITRADLAKMVLDCGCRGFQRGFQDGLLFLGPAVRLLWERSMSNALIRIPFHETEVLAVDVDGKPHVVLRPAIEALGLDFEPQRKKLSRRAWATTSLKEVVAADGKPREMVTVDVRTFLMLLATIDAQRVKPEARPLLLNAAADYADTCRIAHEEDAA